MLNRFIRAAALAGLGAVALAPAAAPARGKAMKGVTKTDFGRTADGRAVDLYTLTNAHGVVAKIITYGGIVTELHVPDKAGKMADVVLGFDNLKGYLDGHPYFGAITGRYANRIAGGKFTLDGKPYTLATNNGPNALHGGTQGFDKRVWTAAAGSGNDPALTLTYRSPAGEEGYPGTLDSTVTYTLTDDNALRIDYEARTDAATPINLTNHSYFNLAGHNAGTILDHVAMIAADAYTPVDKTLIPTGEVAPVRGTPLDFTTPTPIGARLQQVGGDPVGYDHNFVLRQPRGDARNPALAARVTEPKSGRVLEVFTTEPGIQFYTGNFLDGTVTGKGGAVYKQHNGFCLEAQHFPDSPNKPQFPSAVLRPGQTYRQTTVYRFTTAK
jgi:aldose 1-epimerase